MDENRIIYTTRKSLVCELSLVVSTVIIFLLLTTIVNLIHPVVDVSRIYEIISLPDNNFLKPEPLERILFLTGVFGWPILLFVFYQLFEKLIERMEITFSQIEKTDSLLKIFLATSISTLVFWGLSETDYYILQKSVAGNVPTALISAIIVLFLSIAIVDSNKLSIMSFISSVLSFSATLFSFVSIFGIVFFSIYDLNVIYHTGTYVEHLNAVLHAVAQVYNGKELLVDLTHQYGMYPHFLEPLFKLVGLSMLSFTTVMGLLTGLALILIYRFMKDICEHSIVAVFGFCALIYYGYFFSRINFNFDQYFQYHPVRFLCPAVAIFLSYRYFKSCSKKLYYFMFLFCSISVYWNLDTGVVVFFSWLLALLYKEYSCATFKNMLVHIFAGIAIFIAFSAAFNMYLFLRYGDIPDYATFMDYQRIFYTYGYAMLPMKLFGPWNLVILMYLLGIVYSIAKLDDRNGDYSIKGIMVFYLAISGTGLFVYYQGRSHDLNLVIVCYPAIVIAAVFADNLLTAYKSRGLSFDKVVFCILMAFFLYCTGSLLKNIPDIASDTFTRLRLAVNGDITPTSTRADFVRQITVRGGEVLILSSLSGLYYMVSGTSCPIKIPGPTELFLKADYAKIYEYIKSYRCAYLIYDSNFVHSNPHKRKIAEAVDENFVVAAASPDGSIFLLKKRSLSGFANSHACLSYWLGIRLISSSHVPETA